MEILKIDDKWSVEYDPKANDRPVRFLRYGEPSSDWNENNAVTAMFYELLRTKNEGCGSAKCLYLTDDKLVEFGLVDAKAKEEKRELDLKVAQLIMDLLPQNIARCIIRDWLREKCGITDEKEIKNVVV